MLAQAGLSENNVGRIKTLIQAPVSDPGGYFGRIVSALDDALFDAQGDAAMALEDLLEMTESYQVAAKYFQRPDILAVIEGLQQALMDSGGVGKTNALPDVVKVVNRELHTGDGRDYRIPETVPAVAQTLLQFQSSHRPQDLWHMVTPDFQSTAIWVQLNSGDNQDMSRVMDNMDQYLSEHPLPEGVTARWAGKTFINVIWQRTMVAGMLKSLLGAFVAVFLMMALLFRSVLFGLLAMLPLTATILTVYGIIGWTGKYYDMPVAVLSSLTLGLSVDFAIHFIQRMRNLYRKTGSFTETARQIFEAPSRAITRNMIVIALGFTPLLLAPLLPYVTVGVFMASIMAISGLATLVLLPAVMSVLRAALFRGSTDDGGVME
jgi:predicted RND superfamily exporter protein